MTSGPGITWRDDVVVPVSCGAAAVLAMIGTAAAGLAVVGVSPAGDGGPEAVALVVAAAVGAPVDVTASATLGPVPLTLPATVGAVPLLVTLAGAAVLAGSFRTARYAAGAAARRRAGIAVLTVAAATAVLARFGEVHAALSRTVTLDAAPRAGAALLGGLLLASLALAPGLLGTGGAGRRRGPGAAATCGALVVTGLLLASAVGARAGLGGMRWLLALPDLALQLVSRGTGVPWTVEMPAGLASPGSRTGSPFGALPDGLPGGAPDGAPGGLSGGGDVRRRLGPLASLPDVGWWLPVAAVLAAVVVAVVVRGLVLRRRGDRREAAGRVVRYALAGGAGLALGTRGSSLSLHVGAPFGLGDRLSAQVSGNAVLAVAIGLVWGAAAALAVTAVARAGGAGSGGGRRILDRSGEVPGHGVPVGGAGVGDGRGLRG